jgi:hypothetical protein
MKPRTQYGWLAGKHWRKFCPKLVAELDLTKNQASTQLGADAPPAESPTPQSEADNLKQDYEG